MASQARALFDYEAVEETELSIIKDDIVEIEEVNDSGWCLVRLGEETGWVPADYIEEIEGGEPAPEFDEDPVVYQEPVPEPEPVPERVIEPEPVPQELEPIAYDALVEPEPEPEPEQPEPQPEPVSAPQDKKMNQEEADQLANTVKSLDLLGPGPTPEGEQKFCHACNKIVEQQFNFVVAKEKVFHTDCFRCISCDKPLGGQPFIEKDGKFYCEDDYYAAFNPSCGNCGEIIKGQYISALDQSWHPECFVCTECKEPFTGNQYRKHENKPYCEAHFKLLFAQMCSKCSLPIEGQVFEAMGKRFHLACFTCEVCEQPIGEGVNFHVSDGKVYCPPHFEEKFLQKCAECQEVIKGQYLKVMDQHFHPECWKCNMCKCKISASNCAQKDLKFFCRECVKKVPSSPSSNTPPKQPPASPTPGPSQPTPAPTTPAPAAAASPTAAGPVMVYSYAALKNNEFDRSAVDVKRKEDYLADDIFAQLFKIDRAKFGKLPAWRRKKLKQDVRLF